MRVTIGEVINDILPYSNSVDVKLQGSTPFVHALMNNLTLFTRFHLYVVQIDEHKYAACDTIDIIDDKYIPTGNSLKPLVTEKEFVSDWISQKEIPKNLSVVNQLDHNRFMDYLIERLSYHEVIKFDPANRVKHVSDLISSGTKCKRQVTKAFQDSGCKSDTVKDFIDFIWKQGCTINLAEIKEKDFSSIITKLTKMGIEIVHKDRKIVKINFEKRR